MTDPTLVSRDALRGVPIGLSVSRSADLAMLGLTEKHCELVIAELTRALLLAGATVVYGGRLDPSGYTTILLNEVQQFHEGEAAVEVVLAESVYREMKRKDLALAKQRLGTLGRVRLVASTGEEIKLADLGAATVDAADPAIALTAMREFVAKRTVARVLVGGQLDSYQGTEPGVIEEARLSAERGALVYVAGGYGGAAAAVALARHGDRPSWAPRDFPAIDDRDAVEAAIERFLKADQHRGWDGLDDEDRGVLEASHRPADIASLVVRGLARARLSDPSRFLSG